MAPQAELSYDYIIVGGGTSGLAVAARLSEDPSISILVLEAGDASFNDPRISVPAGLPGLLGSDVDWLFRTSPQGPGGRGIGVSQGKTLGGSSAINGVVFLMPSRAGFEAWAQMGNPNWSWEAMEPYFKKFCTVNLPKDAEPLNLLSNYPHPPNSQGPIQASWVEIDDNPISKLWLETLESLGWAFKGDIPSGDALGVFATAGTIDPVARQRSYSIAYYNLAAARPNLTVFTKAHVQKINWTETSPLVATGVEYLHEGQIKLAKATREDPQKSSMSVEYEVRISNDNVGENLQDHLLAGFSLEAASGIQTADDLIRQKPEAVEAAMELYLTKQKGPLSQVGFGAVGLLPTPKDVDESTTFDELLDRYPPKSSDPPHHAYVRSILKSSTEASGKHFLYAAQGGWGASNAKEFMLPKSPGNYMTPAVVLLNPLSSGCTHIASTDADQPPVIDPKYLSHPIDVEVFARHLKYLDQKVMKTSPINALVNSSGNHHPLYQKYGPFQKLDNVKQYVCETAMTNWHVVGTCAMLPREKGGVVDENLKVYGTENLRVVDASIMPMIPRANTITTVYAVAEKAADIIKKGN